ncbi:hypothetical protein KYLE_8 [Pantoea phage Kyle]|uniref:Uncharacterized protein n=1 Tax=Pantoea phage Kyle TaxID=2589665 RepID=A0A514A8T5_9CAUD|nr:hypothetical protein HWC52_gp008 [Pantoea phage Kyle]QDH49682.1 hypothetical protein KYLE_8 [Pantoea phage Kyle]
MYCEIGPGTKSRSRAHSMISALTIISLVIRRLMISQQTITHRNHSRPNNYATYNTQHNHSSANHHRP